MTHETQLIMPAKLAAAFVKAQQLFTGASKDSNNPHFNKKYADLASVREAIKAGLEANGLGFIQKSVERPNAAAVETIIVHESGEMFSCGVMVAPLAKNDAQGFGSAMTYIRRYSLAAAFGIAPEDDDAAAAVKSGPVSATLPASAKPASVPVSAAASAADGEVTTPANATAIRQALMAGGRDEASMLSWLKTNAKSLDMISPLEAERAAKSLGIVLPEAYIASSAPVPVAKAAASSF